MSDEIAAKRPAGVHSNRGCIDVNGICAVDDYNEKSTISIAVIGDKAAKKKCVPFEIKRPIKTVYCIEVETTVIAIDYNKPTSEE